MRNYNAAKTTRGAAGIQQEVIKNPAGCGRNATADAQRKRTGIFFLVRMFGRCLIRRRLKCRKLIGATGAPATVRQGCSKNAAANAERERGKNGRVRNKNSAGR